MAPAVARAPRYSRTVSCRRRCSRAREIVERDGSASSDAVTAASFSTSPSAQGRPDLFVPDLLTTRQLASLHFALKEAFELAPRNENPTAYSPVRDLAGGDGLINGSPTESEDRCNLRHREDLPLRLIRYRYVSFHARNCATAGCRYSQLSRRDPAVGSAHGGEVNQPFGLGLSAGLVIPSGFPRRRVRS